MPSRLSIEIRNTHSHCSIREVFPILRAGGNGVDFVVFVVVLATGDFD